jgi:DNA-directed RNA polymerase specialized sigma24 family protein
MIPPSVEPTAHQLDLLSHVVRDVARFQRLSPEDAQDFAQSVQRWLLEQRYDIFARYTGRSSLRTYLTIIVTRLLLEWRKGHLSSRRIPPVPW